MLNPVKLMRLKTAFESFTESHPQLKTFWEKAYPDLLVPGSALEITVTSPEGKPLRYRMTATEGDMDFFSEIKELER